MKKMALILAGLLASIAANADQWKLLTTCENRSVMLRHNWSNNHEQLIIRGEALERLVADRVITAEMFTSNTEITLNMIYVPHPANKSFSHASKGNGTLVYTLNRQTSDSLDLAVSHTDQEVDLISPPSITPFAQYRFKDCRNYR